MMNVTVNRQHLTGNFTKVSNSLIEDARLSCEARILLQWILSRHPNYEGHCFDKWKEVIGVGINKLKKVLAELVEFGYASIITQRNQYGQFERNGYTFYQLPNSSEFSGSISEPESIARNPFHGFEQPTYYNNTTNNTSLSCQSKTENPQITEDDSGNLTFYITSSFNEMITENQELNKKVEKMSDKKAFLTNLVQTVKQALATLKHPEAKTKFIRSIIFNKIVEFKVKKEEQTQGTEICERVIQHLNALTGSSYKPTSKTNRELISGLISEGFTESEIITVIDKKYAEWNGTDWAWCLRPSTLFGRRFEDYLNAAPRPKTSSQEAQYGACGIKIQIPPVENPMAKYMSVH